MTDEEVTTINQTLIPERCTECGREFNGVLKLKAKRVDGVICTVYCICEICMKLRKYKRDRI